MKKRLAIAFVLAAGALSFVGRVEATQPVRDVMAYYRLLANEKLIADVLENKGGVWGLRAALDNEEVRQKEPTVVDVKNGYIHAVFECGPCSTNLEIAYFITADKRNFVAVSERANCMESTNASFRFFADAGQHLQPVSPAPIAVTCKDFFDEAVEAIDPTVEQGAARCIIVHHLPRVGTTVVVTVDGVTRNTGDDQSISDKVEAFLAKNQKYRQLEFAWDAHKAQFALKSKVARKKS
jgi:hypothetical protein